MPLIEEAHKASRVLLDHAYVRIAARASPDAVCAAALLAHALRRENVDFHVSFHRRLDDTVAKVLAEERADCLLLIGLGADAALDEPVASRRVALDPPGASFRADALVQDDAALASLAHLVAAGISKRNADLAPIALAGALADLRHVGTLHGLDAEVLHEALDAGVMLREAALALHGHSLLASLASLDTPFVAGVTGRARNVKKLVTELKLSGDALPASLRAEDAEKLGDILTLRLLQQHAPDAALDALFRPALRGLRGPLAGIECGELARLVEAACAAGRCGLAFATLWPDAAAGGEALEISGTMREELVAALLRAERDAKRDGRLIVAEAPRAALCQPLADRIALSFAPHECVALVHAPEGEGAFLAMRSWSVDVGAAARRVGGSGTARAARAWTSDATHAVKSLSEAIV